LGTIQCEAAQRRTAKQKPVAALTAADQRASRPKFLAAGDTALVVEFGDRVDPHISALVLGLERRIAAAGIAGVVETVPTFRSLMVHYDPLEIANAELKARIAPLCDRLETTGTAGRRWRLPACYDAEFGPDLEDVARRTGLTPAQVVERHSATAFQVYMIGFLPGFAYLGGLPAELELPRRENPRLKVEAGSIAIAMTMSVIYSIASPGGWNILGRTPVPLWDLRRDPSALVTAGDEVTFAPISLREYERLAARAHAGELHIEPLSASA
jgi:KipI family sensor histidine kinase inhibitor